MRFINLPKTPFLVPVPDYDTGMGVHNGSDTSPFVAGTAENNWAYEENYQIALGLRRRGITRIKIISDGGEQSIMLCKACVDAGLFVVVRAQETNPGRHFTIGAKFVRDHVAVGVLCFEFANEINLPEEGLASVEESCLQIMRNTDVIVANGGISLLPSMTNDTVVEIEAGSVCYQSIIRWFKANAWDWFYGHALAGHFHIAGHPRDIGHPLDYPDEPVNRLGIPLTAAEVADHRRQLERQGDAEGLRILDWLVEQKNIWRAEDKNPDKPLSEDSACIRSYELTLDVFEAELGFPLPYHATEAGPVCGDCDDRRYLKVMPDDHARIVMEMLQRLRLGHPKAWRPELQGFYLWLWDKNGHYAFPEAAYIDNDIWGGPFPGRNLPAVAQIEAWAQSAENVDRWSEAPVEITPPPDPTPDPVPEPRPTPAPVVYLKLAPHAQSDRPGLKEAILNGHFRLAKTMFHDPIFWRAVREARPDLFLVGRVWDPWQLFTDDPEQRGRAFADKVLGEVPVALYDAVESYNEFFGYTNPNDWSSADRFMAAFYDRIKAVAPHLEPIAGNCGVGNLLGEDWTQHFPRTLARYRLFGFHEYGWPSMEGDDGWRVLRYRKIMPAILSVRPDALAIVTECGLTNAAISSQPDVGYRTIMEPEQYWDELRWYDARLNEDPYVLGGCVFQMGAVLGGTPDWSTFEVLGTSIIDRMAELPAGPAIKLEGGAPPPEEDKLDWVEDFAKYFAARPQLGAVPTEDAMQVTPEMVMQRGLSKGKKVVVIWTPPTGTLYYEQRKPRKKA